MSSCRSKRFCPFSPFFLHSAVAFFLTIWRRCATVRPRQPSARRRFVKTCCIMRYILKWFQTIANNVEYKTTDLAVTSRMWWSTTESCSSVSASTRGKGLSEPWNNVSPAPELRPTRRRRLTERSLTIEESISKAVEDENKLILWRSEVGRRRNSSLAAVNVGWFYARRDGILPCMGSRQLKTMGEKRYGEELGFTLTLKRKKVSSDKTETCVTISRPRIPVMLLHWCTVLYIS